MASSSLYLSCNAHHMGRGEMMRGAIGESYGEHLEENIEKEMDEITVLVGGSKHPPQDVFVSVLCSR
jgi:hypothetical protein